MEFLYIALAATIGWALGWWQAKRVTPKLVDAAVVVPFTKRCHTITYTYSDGSAKTYHECQGHTEFTDHFGHAHAPAGATLRSARGGTHRG